MSCLTDPFDPLEKQLDPRAKDFVATRHGREPFERISSFTGGPLRISGDIVVERVESRSSMIGQLLMTEHAPARFTFVLKNREVMPGVGLLFTEAPCRVPQDRPR